MSIQTMSDELLDDRTYDIEFNGHLTNHVKHAVVALRGLGAPPEKIKAYYENYTRLTPYGYPLEPPRPSRHVISEANWDHFLGRRTSFASYCEFFDRQERELGMDELLRRYVPVLLPGWVGSFTHAAIHLGWALDVDSRWMAIEGLAYMAFSYVSCHPERATRPAGSGAGAGDETAVDSLLRVAGAWDAGHDALRSWVEDLVADVASGAAAGIHPELARSGLQYRIARLLEEGHPLIYETPAWIDAQDVSTSWEQLYHAVTLLYLAVPGDFVVLHLITSLHAMEQIAERLPPEEQASVVKCFWIGMQCIMFSQGQYPARRKLAALHATYESAVDAGEHGAERDWEQIIARAVEEEEEHNPKAVYVLRRAWRRTGGRSIYRSAAAQFTATPELPKSFEEPPVDSPASEDGLAPEPANHSARGTSAATVSIEKYLGRNVHLLTQTNELRALHTIIRDRTAARDDFVFCAGRIIRLLVEAGLNLLPFERHVVDTPVGRKYEGVRTAVPICGVSVVRAGDSMEAGLRAVCRSIRIGKILIQRDKVTKLPHLYYSALPSDIAERHVLLLDPMLATGGTALSAIQLLLDKGVAEEKIIFINLLTVPEGISAVCQRHPSIRIVTSAIDERLNSDAYMLPGIGDFGDRFFGTDR